VSCTYRAHGRSVSGTTSNTDNALAFTNQQFDLTAGPATCFANGYFTAPYAPVVDTSQAGNPPVFVN